MGRLVEDARSAVDALTKDELVDPARIYLFGYSLGGTVAMYEAALDSRVKGIVSIAGSLRCARTTRSAATAAWLDTALSGT